jgi:hypothetical protein
MDPKRPKFGAGTREKLPDGRTLEERVEALEGTFEGIRTDISMLRNLHIASAARDSRVEELEEFADVVKRHLKGVTTGFKPLSPVSVAEMKTHLTKLHKPADEHRHGG